MEMLEKLRNANFERQEKKALGLEIQKQFDQINKLTEEKEVLLYKLQALSEGHVATDLYPRYASQDPEFLAAHKTLASLKQKISAYRLLGPCGLSVLQVSTKTLVLSFTSMWKDLTQTFMLRIADDHGTIKVAGTTIPYFIDVDSKLTSADVTEWPKIMDAIGLLLNAYTQRRREVEHIKSEYASHVRQMTWNDPVTNVDIHLAVTNTERPDAPNLQLDISLVYSDNQALHPVKVRIASSHYLPMEEVTAIRSLMKTELLSEAFKLVVEKLGRIPYEDEEADDDDDNESNADGEANDNPLRERERRQR